MRINNPKALGYFAGETKHLATVDQLENAVKAVNNRFCDLLIGTEIGKNGLNGFTNKTGYAYLDTNGKLPASLLPPGIKPSIYIVFQSVIRAQSVDLLTNEEFGAQEVERRLKEWMRRLHVDANNNQIYLHQGDFVVILPDIGTDPDPLYCGAYFTAQTREAEYLDGLVPDCTFVRLSYFDNSAEKITSLEARLAELEARLDALQP